MVADSVAKLEADFGAIIHSQRNTTPNQALRKNKSHPLQGVWDGGRVAFLWFISGFFQVEDIHVLPLVFGTGPQAAVASLVLECSS